MNVYKLLAGSRQKNSSTPFWQLDYHTNGKDHTHLIDKNATKVLLSVCWLGLKGFSWLVLN